MRHCTQSYCQHCKREIMQTAVSAPLHEKIASFLLMFNCSFYNESTKRHTADSTRSTAKLVWTLVSHYMQKKHHEINSLDFLCGGGKINCVPAVFNLFTVWWSNGLVFVWVVAVEIDSGLDAGRKSLGFSVSLKLTRCLSGWSTLSWLQTGVSNLTWFQCRGRHWFGFGLGVDYDFGLVSGSKLTWILWDDVDRK